MFLIMFHNFFIIHNICQTLYFNKIKWDNSSIFLYKYFCHEYFKLTPFMNFILGNFLNFFPNSRFCLNIAIQIILMNSDLFSTDVPMKILASASFISNKNGYSNVKITNLLIFVVQRVWGLMCFKLDQTRIGQNKKSWPMWDSYFIDNFIDSLSVSCQILLKIKIMFNFFLQCNFFPAPIFRGTSTLLQMHNRTKSNDFRWKRVLLRILQKLNKFKSFHQAFFYNWICLWLQNCQILKTKKTIKM